MAKSFSELLREKYSQKTEDKTMVTPIKQKSSFQKDILTKYEKPSSTIVKEKPLKLDPIPTYKSPSVSELVGFDVEKKTLQNTSEYVKSLLPNVKHVYGWSKIPENQKIESVIASGGELVPAYYDVGKPLSGLEKNLLSKNIREREQKKLEERHPISKSLSRISETITKTATAQPTEVSTKTGSKTLDVISDLIGTGLGYATPMGGGVGAGSLLAMGTRGAESLLMKAGITATKSPAISKAIAKASTTTAGKLGYSAVEGALSQIPISAIEGSAQGLEIKDILKKVGIESSFAAGISPLIRGVGIGIKKGITYLKKPPQITNEILHESLINPYKKTTPITATEGKKFIAKERTPIKEVPTKDLKTRLSEYKEGKLGEYSYQRKFGEEQLTTNKLKDIENKIDEISKSSIKKADKQIMIDNLSVVKRKIIQGESLEPTTGGLTPKELSSKIEKFEREKQTQPKTEVVKPIEEKNIPKTDEVPPQIMKEEIPTTITEPLKGKERKFITSMKESEYVDPRTKEIIAQDTRRNYEEITNKETFNKAYKAVEADYKGSLEKFSKMESVTSADDTALGGSLIYKLQKEGKIIEAAETGLELAEKLTRAGQTIQAAKIIKAMSPEGLIGTTARKVNKAMSDLKKQSPKRAKKIAEEIETTTKAIKETEEEIIEEISEKITKVGKGEKIPTKVTEGEITTKIGAKEKELPEEILAKKVESTTKQKNMAESDFEKDMVKELYKVAKESPLPVDKIVKENPLEILKQAIVNKDRYKDVWDSAKDILKTKYKDDAEVSKILENYFKKGIIPTYSESTFIKVYNGAIKFMGDKLYSGNRENALNMIKKYVISNTMARGKDAELLSNKIAERFDGFFKFKFREERLADKIINTIKQPQTPKEKNVLNNLINEMYQKARETMKLEVKTTPKVRDKIADISDAIKNKTMTEDMWDRARTIVKDKFKTDIEAQGILDKYYYEWFGKSPIGRGLDTIFSQKTLSGALRQGMKEADITLKDIIATPSKGRQLINYVLNKSKLTGTDRILLSQKLNREFKNLKDIYKEKMAIRLLTPKEKTTAIKKNTFNKVMELVNLGAYRNSKLVNIIKEAKGIPTLTEKDLNLIYDNMKKMKELPNDSWKSRALMSEITTMIKSKEVPTFIEKFRAGQMMSLLSLAKTFIVNIFGNIPSGAIEGLRENTIGAFIDKITSSVRKSERTTISAPITKGTAYIKGYSTGIKEFGLDIGGGWENLKKSIKNKDDIHSIFEAYKKDRKLSVDTSRTQGLYEGQKRKRIFSESGRTFGEAGKVVGRYANNIRETIIRGLQLGDRGFFEGAYQSRIAELKKIKNTNEITPEMLMDANYYGLEKVWQEKNLMSDKLRDAKKWGGAIGEISLPFTQTAGAMFDKVLDYSPIGMAKAVYLLGKSKTGFNQKLFVDRLSRSIMGSVVMAPLLGYGFAKLGILTGREDKRANVRAYKKETTGFQPYSFKIGEKYYGISNLQPIASTMMMGADFYNAGISKEDFLSKLGAGVESSVSTLFSLDFLMGITGLLAANSLLDATNKFVYNMFSQGNPTVSRAFSSLVDDYVRETYDPDSTQQIINKLKANISFLSKTLPKKISVTGKEIKRYNGENSLFNVMFSPIKTSKVITPNAAQSEILRLFAISDDPKLIPNLVQKNIGYTIGGKKYEKILTPEEFTKYQQLYGRYIEETFSKIVNSEEYKKSDNDFAKSKALNITINNALDISKKQMIKEDMKKLYNKQKLGGD